VTLVVPPPKPKKKASMPSVAPPQDGEEN